MPKTRLRGVRKPPQCARPVTDLAQPQLALRILLTIVVGSAGGAVFAWLKLPLPWMLGSLCAVTLAALMGAPMRFTQRGRSVMAVVLGVLLGSTFTPDLFARLGSLLSMLGVLAIYVFASMALGMGYFLWIAKQDRVTAYFCSAPGGFAEMILVGEAMGAEPRQLSLAHAVRVLMTVLAVPLWFRYGADIPSSDMVRPMVLAIPWQDGGILVACGVAGWFVASRIKLGAAPMLGPMAFSAAAHISGLTEFAPPFWLVAAAQVALGAAAGARFAGLALAVVGRALAIALGWSVLLLGLLAALAKAAEHLAGFDYAVVMLAMAPAGMAEMGLVALALGIDTAFVSTVQVIRLTSVVVLTPSLFRLLGWKREAPS
ncbi:MAG: AbrB family transcriptional regulator [Alphaproteobacteria bacterium]|nr:AbrB family transcriptional regulator [Alphaproteobacteria bacterium]